MISAHTEGSEHWYDLYISNHGRWLTISGASLDPTINDHAGKVAMLRIANQREITEALIEGLEAAADALRTRLGMLSE